MEMTCTACSARLAISDAKVPQNAVFTVTCPKCQTKTRVSTKGEGRAAPPDAATVVAAAPPPALAVPPSEPVSYLSEAFEEEDWSVAVSTEEDFVENQKLALLCLAQPTIHAEVKTTLEGMGYTVHLPDTAEDAIQKIRRNQYALVILHEAYGGSGKHNLVLQAIQPMAMSLRRNMCVGLVGKFFRTFDHMTAFAQSVNFVVAERELSKIKAIARQAVAANDKFYRVFREALRDAGKQ